MKLSAIRYSLLSFVLYPSTFSLSTPTISSTEQSIFQHFFSTERVKFYCSHCRLLTSFATTNYRKLLRRKSPHLFVTVCHYFYIPNNYFVGFSEQRCISVSWKLIVKQSNKCKESSPLINCRVTFPTMFPFAYNICHTAQKKQSLRYKKKESKTSDNLSVTFLPGIDYFSESNKLSLLKWRDVFTTVFWRGGEDVASLKSNINSHSIFTKTVYWN